MARKVLICVLFAFFALITFPSDVMAEAVSKVTVKELIVMHSMEMGLDPALALSIAKKEILKAFIPENYRMMDVGKIAQLSEAEAFAQSL